MISTGNSIAPLLDTRNLNTIEDQYLKKNPTRTGAMKISDHYPMLPKCVSFTASMVSVHSFNIGLYLERSVPSLIGILQPRKVQPPHVP